MTGQVRALNYLKECRGGDFVNLAANYEGGDPSLQPGRLMNCAGSLGPARKSATARKKREEL